MSAFDSIIHFTASEYGEWADDVDMELVKTCDVWRSLVGSKIIISPNTGSLGRRSGSVKSRHYAVGRKFDAQDVFLPEVIGHIDSVNLDQYNNLKKVLEYASHLFGGIGLYPYWKPYVGLHVDKRPFKKDGSPALWGHNGRDYCSLQEALKIIEDKARTNYEYSVNTT